LSWNGSGVYSLPALYFPEAPGNLVDSTRYNGTLNDISTGLNNALAKDGQNSATANLPMGGFKHTGAVAASTSGEYVLFGQTLPNLTLTGELSAGNNRIWNAVQLIGVGNINLPVKTSVGFGGGIVLASGSDTGGVAWARLYLLAVRQFGGSGALVTSVLVSTSGPGTPPTIVFADVAGTINAAVSGASANQTIFFPIGGFAAV
jgi:hypothetical protein